MEKKCKRERTCPQLASSPLYRVSRLLEFPPHEQILTESDLRDDGVAGVESDLLRWKITRPQSNPRPVLVNG